MCELFALSSRHATTVQLSLEEFSRHGGLSGPHKDGWGIAWYEDRDVRLVKETYPASESACVSFVQHHPPQSGFVVSHIRRATRGIVATRNCQPFVRELGGCWHCFAHNGDLDAIGADGRFAALTYRPVGETDSEQAFCALLERLRPLWPDAGPPSLQARLDVVASFAADLRTLGPANFLYCDSDALFVHADRRRQSDGAIRSPGLWRLERHCRSGGGALDAQGLRLSAADAEQDVQLVASVPLTGEGWVPLAEGSVHVLRLGQVERCA